MSSNLNIVSRSKQAIPDLLNLEDYYTDSLDDDWMGKGCNLSSFPKGVHAYARAAFDVRGLIQLAGKDGDTNPKLVTGMKVGFKGQKFYFLHGVIGSASKDTKIGEYVVNFVDGQILNIPLIFGRGIRDSLKISDKPLTDAQIAWTDTEDSGKVQLYRYSINNELPDVEIKTIDFISSLSGAAPFVIGITVEGTGAVYEWFDSVSIYNPIIERSPLSTDDQIDLTDYYSTSLDDDWFHHSGHDFHDVPKGHQAFNGIYFDVRGLILLGGSGSLKICGLALPEELLGIRINRSGKAISFLHACAFDSPPNTQIGEYIVNYVDGSCVSVPIVYSENVMDWWENPEEGQVSKAKETWFGSNAATRRVGKRTRLIQYTWDNVKPDVEIDTIDYVTCLNTSAPFCVAITVIP